MAATIGKVNNGPPNLKQQEQDSPLASIGRYGLFRALMQQGRPTLHPTDPVSAQLALKLRSRNNVLDY